MFRDCLKCGAPNPNATGDLLETCPKCGAIYAKVAAARETEETTTRPSGLERGVGVFLRIVAGLISVAFLLFGFLIAAANGPGGANANVWVALCLVGLVAAIFITAKAPTGWAILVLVGSIFFSFSSCSHNFHWRG